MIFKTFDKQMDSLGNITKGVAFFGKANAQQKVFDLNEIEKYVQSQAEYFNKYNEAYSKAISEATAKDESIDDSIAHNQAMESIKDAVEQYTIFNPSVNQYP